MRIAGWILQAFNRSNRIRPGAHVSPAQWQKLVAAQQSSGLSQGTPVAKHRWIELQAVTGERPWRIELDLGNGLCLRLTQGRPMHGRWLVCGCGCTRSRRTCASPSKPQGGTRKHRRRCSEEAGLELDLLKLLHASVIEVRASKALHKGAEVDHEAVILPTGSSGSSKILTSST